MPRSHDPIIKNRILKALKAGPKTSEQLATRCKVDRRKVYRYLHHLSTDGWVIHKQGHLKSSPFILLN